jgi:cytochrome c-type biogenesis protein CcmH/NrfG
LVLGGAGLVVMLRPLGLTWQRKLALFALLLLLITLSYARWGHFPAWYEYLRVKRQQEQMKILLASHAGREGLIKQLRARLKRTPDNAYGWVLLAKLYLTQGDKLHAREAFAMARQLNPI